MIDCIYVYIMLLLRFPLTDASTTLVTYYTVLYLTSTVHDLAKIRYCSYSLGQIVLYMQPLSHACNHPLRDLAEKLAEQEWSLCISKRNDL